MFAPIGYRCWRVNCKIFRLNFSRKLLRDLRQEILLAKTASLPTIKRNLKGFQVPVHLSANLVTGLFPPLQVPFNLRIGDLW